MTSRRVAASIALRQRTAIPLVRAVVKNLQFETLRGHFLEHKHSGYACCHTLSFMSRRLISSPRNGRTSSPRLGTRHSTDRDSDSEATAPAASLLNVSIPSPPSATGPLNGRVQAEWSSRTTADHLAVVRDER